MPLRRMGRPGLVGTMARTAVVAGTANATVGAMNRRRASKAQEEMEDQAAQQAAYQSQQELADMRARVAAMEAQQASAAPPPPPPAAPSAGGDDLMAKLQQLGDMHASGLLSDDEFAAAKARLLG